MQIGGVLLSRPDASGGPDLLARSPTETHDWGMVRGPDSTVGMRGLTAPTWAKGNAAMLVVWLAAILC